MSKGVFMNKSALLRMCFIGCCLLPMMLSGSELRTVPKMPSPAEIKESNLVRIRLNPEWRMSAEKPSKNWMNLLPKTTQGVRLVNHRTDFDTVFGKRQSPLSECVVYNEFESPASGIAQLGIGCDWWFEAYCNGTLLETTFPGGNESNLFRPENNPFFLPVRKGKNLLAVRLRRGSETWTFTCGPVPFQRPEQPKILPPLWLGNPDTGKMTIRFGTCGSIGAGVEYRKKGESAWKMQWDHRLGQILRRSFHSVPLKDLEPGSFYEFRIVLIDPKRPEKRIYPEADRIHTFRSPDSVRKTFRFFFTSDLQFQAKRQAALLKSLMKAADAASCDFLVLGGDINNAINTIEDDPLRVIHSVMEYGGAGKPLILVRGNHELRGREADRFLDYFAMPNGRSYGIFRFGDTAFLILDCWEDKPAASKGASYCKYNLDKEFLDEQTRGVNRLLKSEQWTSAKRRIVLAHGAPYSHPGQFMPKMFQKMTDPYFAGKNPVSRINLWLAGHTHCYTRSIPGTNRIAALEKPRKPNKGGEDYVYPVLTGAGPGRRKLQVSAFRVDVSENDITVRAFAPDGQCFDTVVYTNDGKTKELVPIPHHEFGN